MKSGTVPNTTSRTRETIHPFRNGPSEGPFFLQGHKGISHLNMQWEVQSIDCETRLEFTIISTRNSFHRGAPGATTHRDSAIKVSGGRTPRVLSRAAQLIKPLPRAATWSDC